ncbi:MAG: alpha/beta fold hydrolase [Longimicrobiales bacterium]|nr:alpha/beta fold hydrolase [Longimicrobiales bacterium]
MKWTRLALALGLILAGDVLAWSVQTDLGRIDVRDVRWEDDTGRTMSALLYVPPGATPDDPAPGVLAVHGYINSRETQDGFAIELARRGFVVLAMDQTGHGYSDPPAFRAGFGGPAGLAYLRSLPMVDTANVGLEGHSMGGWAVLIAAARAPDAYRSVVLEGSSTGSSGAPGATPEEPRNLAVVFSLYDEFSGAMWGSPVAADVPSSDKLMVAFGTDEPVVPGRLYGSIAEGNARIFHQPPVTHPADHFSTRAIGHAVDWLQRTLEGEAPLPVDDQVWYWKEVGNLVALVGMVLLLLAVGDVLLGTAWFAELRAHPTPTRGATGASWWGAALLFALLPAVTLFPFKDLGAALPVSAFLPQAITNQIVAWAALVGALSAGLFGLWHATSGRRAGATLDDYGLKWEGRWSLRRIGRSFLLAALVVCAGYLSLLASAALVTVDFRFWVFAVKPLADHHLLPALVYLLPFTLFFVVYATVLFGQLRRELPAAREALVVVALSTAGFVVLLLFQYTPLFLGGTLAIPGEALWSIIAFQFLPIMTIVGIVTAFFQRRTGQVWVGAFVSGLLVTWIVVASQATHYGG